MFPTDQTAEFGVPDSRGPADPPDTLDPDTANPNDAPSADKTAELPVLNLKPKAHLEDPQGKPPGKKADEKTGPQDHWRVGTFIGDRYLLERRLGVGAMGEVFLARDRLLKKHVALKVLRADLAKSRATVRRFLREVALAHSVTHPNVVRIYDTGEAHGMPYFSMEHLQGQTLDELIDQGRRDDHSLPMSLREIREVSYEILSGLEAAHRAGIVHRDLKPANVMLTHRGAIVMDFGVAGFDTLPTTPPDPAEARSLVRTEAGTIFGSPAYMAPELWDGAPATVQSDLYSFGVMLYQMLAGVLPIDAPNAREFIERLRNTRPEPVRSRRKDTPWNLSLLVSRCMAPDPDERPQSAQAAASLVTPLAKKWPRVAIAAGLLLVLLGAGAAYFQRADPWVAMGLPDALALNDLKAIIRAYDVGDHVTALRQLERVEVRAPHSAAVAFWRATVEHDMGGERARITNCTASVDRDSMATGGTPWRGDDTWVALASHACQPNHIIAPSLGALLAGTSSPLTEHYLPLAIDIALIPRIEATHERSSQLPERGRALLHRLADPPDFSTNAPLAVRWALARVDLLIALGSLSEARAAMETVISLHPEAPVVKARASWLYDRTGERNRARLWAEAVVHIDPRPALRLVLDQGRLAEAGERVDVYADDPYHEAMRSIWCGYAFRFEFEMPPDRCADLGPGLVHSLWIGGETSDKDTAAMSALERNIVKHQRALNRGECVDHGEGRVLLLHTPPPFETYMAQLDISAALCSMNPAQSDLQRARHLADALIAVAPQDPWATLLQAQVDARQGAATLGRSKRQVVAAQWNDADPKLPLVMRLRQSLNMPPIGGPAPAPSPPPPPSSLPSTP